MLNILLKIKFLLKKPKVVIVIGQERKAVKEAISQVLRQYFKLGQDVFIFETEEKKINKFTFFLKNSELPILVMNNAAEISLPKNLPANTYFILNCDEEKIKGVLDALDNLKTMKFGFKEKNDIFASDIKINGGTNFKVNYKGKIVPFWLKGLLGEEDLSSSSPTESREAGRGKEESKTLFATELSRSESEGEKEQIYAALAAISVGTILGLNLVEISQSLREK